MPKWRGYRLGQLSRLHDQASAHRQDLPLGSATRPYMMPRSEIRLMQSQYRRPPDDEGEESVNDRENRE